MSRRYEGFVHKRDIKDSHFIQTFACDVPTYDPKDTLEANRPSYPETVGLDAHRVFKPEGDGIYPGPGSYHMYHRIDGKLVAVGIIDICPRSTLNSAYFMWHPHFKFLNLGTVGAIIEMEYMRLLRAHFNMPSLKWYHLGEFNNSCPKVNYKLNFKPGQVLCPLSRQWVDFEACKQAIEAVERMTVDEKLERFKETKRVMLSPDATGEPADLIVDEDMLDFAYEQKVLRQGREWVRLSEIYPDKWKETYAANGLIALMRAVGFTNYSNFTFEYKTP